MQILLTYIYAIAWEDSRDIDYYYRRPIYRRLPNISRSTFRFHACSDFRYRMELASL